jgi:hypothetical protein
MATTTVYLEVGSKRVFACADEWPGWCRSGRTEADALAALASYLPRYLAVVKLAGDPKLPLPTAEFEVLERLSGNGTTDFGAPGAVSSRDARPLTSAQLKRLTALVQAAWAQFDQTVARTPAELSKGPRGGGRDRDKMVDHVLGAEIGYLAKAGVKHRTQPAYGDAAALAEHRQAFLAGLAAPDSARGPKDWPPRYSARRLAWHALDHAWEMEDRTPQQS